jgi:uncharacterized membrane protein
MNKRKSSSRPEKRSQPDYQEGLGLERIIFFSDAVFAIAITLLVLEIRLPVGEDILEDFQLFAQLKSMWHEYLAYLISFMVIGTFWMAHHRKFRYIRRYDHRLMILNLLYLMVIAFIPFPSSIISQYPGPTATTVYALTMVLAGLLLAAIWWYASHGGHLIDPDLKASTLRREYIAPLVTAGIFLISIGVAFLDAGISRVVWLLILVSSWYAYR